MVIISRFPSSPLITRVPFFLFGFSEGTQKRKRAKRVLLGNLDLSRYNISSALTSLHSLASSLLLLYDLVSESCETRLLSLPCVNPRCKGLGFRV